MSEGGILLLKIILPRNKKAAKAINIKRYSWDFDYNEDIGYYVSPNNRPSVYIDINGARSSYTTNFFMDVPEGSQLYFNYSSSSTYKSYHVIINGAEVDVTGGYYFIPTEDCVIFGGGDWLYSSTVYEQRCALVMYASELTKKTEFKITLNNDLRRTTVDASFIYINGEYVYKAGSYTAPTDGSCFLQLGSAIKKIIKVNGQTFSDNQPDKARITLPFRDMTIDYSYGTVSRVTTETAAITI